MSSGSRQDPSKIIVLFEKIDKSNNLEIEERSLKNLAQKIQNKLLDVSYICENHANLIQNLLRWIQSRFQQTNQQSLICFSQIIIGIAQRTEGKNLLLNLGAVEILDQIQRNLSENPNIQTQYQEAIKILIQDSFALGTTADNQTKTFNYGNSGKNVFQNETLMKSNSFVLSQSLSQNQQFSQQNILNQIPEREEDPSFYENDKQSQFQTSQMSSYSQQNNQNVFSKTEFKTQIFKAPEASIAIKHDQMQMEVKVKQQILRETCELPFVYLNDEDEKFLFDLGVQLKFGDFKNILSATQRAQNQAFFDFPIEVFLQRTDVIRALIDLLEGAQGQVFTNLALPALIIFVQRLRTLYQYLCDQTNKVSHMPQNERDLAIPLEAYLEQTYPCNHNGRWSLIDQVQDINKYGTANSVHQVKQQNLAAVAIQSSLSCKAVLGLIMTKTINLMKDQEKIGLYIQLLNECIETVETIYRVRDNEEFSSFLHLCMFAFDSVCDYYKEQIFENILLRPILDFAIRFIEILNTIPKSETKMNDPFSECLFLNTTNLQQVMRRSIFRYHFDLEDECQKAKQTIMVKFFARLEEELKNINILQQGVVQNFEKAQNVYSVFLNIQAFKFNIKGLLTEQDSGIVFIETFNQYYQTVQILEELLQCIELRLDFPFEHLLVDCIMYGMLAEETSMDPKLDQLEKTFKNYLLIPLPEIRERIMRKIFQKIRLQQSIQINKRNFNNITLLAKFLFRKQVLNQLINGCLINQVIASEESKLQMTLGHLVIKTLIYAFNDTDHITAKQNLNQHFLTFHSLMGQYPELVGLIDLIEENSQQKQIRLNRIMRDLFNQDPQKRQFATSVLKSNMSKDIQENFIQDILKESFDSKNPQSDLQLELEQINNQYDYSSFDFINITQLLMSSTQDYVIKKQCLDQLTLILFDVTSKKGKIFFKTEISIKDVFSFIIGEVVSSFNTCYGYLRQQVSLLDMNQINYVNGCLKFLVLIYCIYFDEAELKQFFDKFKTLTQLKERQEDLKIQENFQSAVLFFIGSNILRKNAVRLLQIILFHQVYLMQKLQRQQQPNGIVKKNLVIYAPDFIVNAFIMTLPHYSQIVKQPMRDDLVLTEEQKMYVQSRLVKRDIEHQDKQILQKISAEFCQKVADKNENYNQVMRTFETLQNYVLSGQQLKDELVNEKVLTSFVEMIKILPTRDFEFSFLADYLMLSNQILHSFKKFDQNISNLDQFVNKFSEGLKFHLIPFMIETVNTYFSEIENANQNHVYSHKLHFIQRFLESVNNLIQVDSYLKQKFRIKSSVQDKILSNNFINYLFDLYVTLKNHTESKRKILMIFYMIISQYETRNIDLERLPEMLINQVATMKLTMSLQQNSLIFLCIRTLIYIHDKRILMIKKQNQIQDIALSVSLSQTSMKYLQKYQSFGWLVRFIESRDARLRCLSWDLLNELFDYEFLKGHPSIIQQALNQFLKHQELYSVKIAILKFLNNATDLLITNCDISRDEFQGQNYDNFIGSTQEQVTVQSLLRSVSKQGLITQIHNMLSLKDCPLLFLTLTMKFLNKLVQMDYKKALPVLTQLDYWTFLVEYLDFRILKDLELNENRLILKHQKSKLLQFSDPTAQYDQIFLCITSIMEFIFESFKRDQQLANLLVKTTKLLGNVFDLTQKTIDGYNSQTLQFQNHSIMALFIEKTTKLLHIALLHPREYTVEQISKFLFVKQNDKPRNWIYLTEFFELINKISQTSGFYGGNEIKLSICRFIAEYLLRLPTRQQNYLDEMIEQYESQNYFKVNERDDLQAFGSRLLMEMGLVFKQVYLDNDSHSDYQKDQDEQENQKIDITMCICILLSKCQSAKTAAVEQNMMKKVIEICQENLNAIVLQEIQKVTKKKQTVTNKSMITKSMNNSQMLSSAFESQMKRQFKYVNPNDIAQCEREVLRMLQILRHLFYQSSQILIPLLFPKSSGQSIMSTRTVQAKQLSSKETQIGDKFVQLIQNLVEDLDQGSEVIVQETYMTALTFASQNVRFKNAFINVSSAQQQKKQSLIKVLSEHLLNMSAEIAKEIMKIRMIEEILEMIQPQCKNEKEIKLMKNYLAQFSGFLAAYASTDEGQKILLKLKNLFEHVIFILDTVNVQNQNNENTVLVDLVKHNLLFLRNTSFNRTNKLYFIQNENFLPCLLSFLSNQNLIPKIKAYSSACLWMILYNHQGVKQMLNRSEVVNELQLLRQEYQRSADISVYSNYIKAEETDDKIIKSIDNKKISSHETKRMNTFTLTALNGILKLLTQN
ncbi:UNKNOWN [Stylonychia lemnae]|uniref:Rotatin N-terminal domain-containing protein n=1 Tax=Stylonychia lemnae TaxID=5949 RepID=A0A077ZU20_STYLE|nr:UNKNOWN [Stylonychia lemnae]|eukprot:CDW71951.1 UNKNOWN [Stylonychia lemnae]